MLPQTPKVLFVSMIFTQRISELREDLGYNYAFFNGLNYKYTSGEFQKAPVRTQKTISSNNLLWTSDRKPQKEGPVMQGMAFLLIALDLKMRHTRNTVAPSFSEMSLIEEG